MRAHPTSMEGMIRLDGPTVRPDMDGGSYEEGNCDSHWLYRVYV